MARKENLISIVDACRMTGVPRVTIFKRVEKSFIQPVMIQGRTRFYEAEDLLKVARPDRFSKTAYPMKACLRCGVEDYGNDVRGGLCFECWSHDYCKTHKL